MTHPTFLSKRMRNSADSLGGTSVSAPTSTSVALDSVDPDMAGVSSAGGAGLRGGCLAAEDAGPLDGARDGPRQGSPRAASKQRALR